MFHSMLLQTVSCLAITVAASTVGFCESPESVIRVAIYEGDGAGKSRERLWDALVEEDDHRELKVASITAEQIRNGGLSDFDVLVQPGGSGGGQGRALAQEGRTAVREFVRKGGGFLGVCGGAYLATNDYSWSLNLIDAKVVDRRHWARGKGTVTLALSPAGQQLFDQESAQMDILYAQGPLLGRREWDDPKVPDYESLAIYETEIASKGAPTGVMPGTSAIVRSRFGEGRVFCFSPHPELTDGIEHLIPVAVSWLVQREESDLKEQVEVVE